MRDIGKRRDKHNSIAYINRPDLGEISPRWMSNFPSSIAYSELVVRVTTSGSRPAYKSTLPLVPTHCHCPCRVSHFCSWWQASSVFCKVSDRSSLLPALLAHSKLFSYAFRIARQNRSIWLAR